MQTDKTEKTVIALGFFDGIHVGHGELMKMTSRRALELGAVPAVLTFDHHPDTFVFNKDVPLINSADDRVALIKLYYGIEKVCFLHFNDLTMRTPWDKFLDIITQEYGIVHFVVGHDFRFGYRGEGCPELLKQYCGEHGMGCDVIPAKCIDGKIVSSTHIRELLSEGNMAQAVRLLGHPHILTDTVRTGFRLGRTINAPTVNMRFPEGVLVPKFGVYAAKITVDGTEHLAVTNVGMRPTFQGKHITVETHILDYSGELYGQSLTVRFYEFLRPERKFDSPEQLMSQIAEDAATVRRLL